MKAHLEFGMPEVLMISMDSSTYEDLRSLQNYRISICGGDHHKMSLADVNRLLNATDAMLQLKLRFPGKKKSDKCLELIGIVERWSRDNIQPGKIPAKKAGRPRAAKAVDAANDAAGRAAASPPKSRIVTRAMALRGHRRSSVKAATPKRRRKRTIRFKDEENEEGMDIETRDNGAEDPPLLQAEDIDEENEDEPEHDNPPPVLKQEDDDQMDGVEPQETKEVIREVDKEQREQAIKAPVLREARPNLRLNATFREDPHDQENDIESPVLVANELMKMELEGVAAKEEAPDDAQQVATLEKNEQHVGRLMPKMPVAPGPSYIPPVVPQRVSLNFIRRPSMMRRPSLLAPINEDRVLNTRPSQRPIGQGPSTAARDDDEEMDTNPSFVPEERLSVIRSASEASNSLEPARVTPPNDEGDENDLKTDDIMNLSSRASLSPRMKQLLEDGLRNLPSHLRVRRTLERYSAAPSAR
ncbi:unnamed protein product, partial [Mesorhabditis spiculigera]